jgi:hypothetical protein
MGDVVILPVETTLDLPLDRILDGALAAELNDCLLMGYDKDGQFYMASMTTDAGAMLVLLERARSVLRRQLGIEG